MIVLMERFAEGGVLAGAQKGERVARSLLEETKVESTWPEPMYLDFGGVDVVTASFFREAVFEFRNAIRRRRSTLYPVVANLDDESREELEVLILAGCEPILTCTLTASGQVQDVGVVGELDAKQKLTYDLVIAKGETDAGDLRASTEAGEDVKQTAWNNRLASLARLGLIVEITRGRAKRYRPVISEV